MENEILKKFISFSTPNWKKYALHHLVGTVSDWRQPSVTAKPFEDSFYRFLMLDQKLFRRPKTKNCVGSRGNFRKK